MAGALPDIAGGLVARQRQPAIAARDALPSASEAKKRRARRHRYCNGWAERPGATARRQWLVSERRGCQRSDARPAAARHRRAGGTDHTGGDHRAAIGHRSRRCCGSGHQRRAALPRPGVVATDGGKLAPALRQSLAATARRDIRGLSELRFDGPQQPRPAAETPVIGNAAVRSIRMPSAVVGGRGRKATSSP